VFTSVTHLLISSEFDELFYLGFGDLWIIPKSIGGYIVNIRVTSPLMNVGKIFGDIFENYG
jgi:hypothetical protein